MGGGDEDRKVIFVCCGNNGRGNDLVGSEIEKMMGELEGVVILDEGYKDF